MTLALLMGAEEAYERLMEESGEMVRPAANGGPSPTPLRSRHVPGSKSSLRVVVVSESAWTVRNHGVHTAFVQQVHGLRRLGHEVIVNDIRACRESDLTITHSPGPWSLAALRAASGLSVAMAHVTPGTLRGSIRGESIWSGAMKRWLSNLYSAADIAVAVSPSTTTEVAATGIAGERIITSPLGVDPPSRSGGGRGRRRKLVLGVGQVQPRKGIVEFAETAAALPEHDFLWAGGRPFGPLTAGGLSDRRLRRLAPPNLSFSGTVSERRLQAFYRAADAFLFLSRQENFGQVVVEAAHHGLPLLLSRIPAFEDHFAPGAMLIEPRHAAPALERLLQDGELADGLAERSNALSARFGATAMTAQLLQRLRRWQTTIGS